MDMKLLIIGHAQHGKDTVASILAECGFKFTSSSEAACRIFLYEALKNKYGYKSIEECFEDRVNRRALWYQLICEYNKENPSRLAKGILEHSNIYVGMRDRREIDACIQEGLFDLIIWVERDLPLEDSSSFNIDKSMADIIIENKGTLEDLDRKVKRLAFCLMKG